MKLVTTLVSLLIAALIHSFALATPFSRRASEASLLRKAVRAHGAPIIDSIATTNAQRFARGLPPLPPSKSRAQGSPTRRDAVSPVPPNTFRGNIEAYDASGSLVGWISSKGNTDGYYDFSSSSSNKLIVTFSLPVGQNSGSGLNLLAENSQKASVAANPFLGFVAYSVAEMATSNSYSFAYLSPTSKTTDTASTGTSGVSSWTYVQSDVWSVNVATGAMSATWTNSDGSVPSLSLYTNGQDPLLCGPGFVGGSFGKLNLKFVPL